MPTMGTDPQGCLIASHRANAPTRLTGIDTPLLRYGEDGRVIKIGLHPEQKAR